jgi:hypothetical protein
MSNEVIKKAKLLESNLPPVSSITEGYDIRYRIISEDKNRVSHWSPITLVYPDFSYTPGVINHTASGNLNTIVWSLVPISKNGTVIKTEQDYDVWVKWHRSDNGDWIYNSRVSGSSLSITKPSTYKINGVTQAFVPDKLSVEIYLKGTPISRDTVFLKVYDGGPWTV